MLFLNHPKLTCFLHFNLNTQIQSEDICIFATNTHNKHKSTTATDCSHPFLWLLATDRAENPLHEVLVLRASGNEPQKAGCTGLSWYFTNSCCQKTLLWLFYIALVLMVKRTRSLLQAPDNWVQRPTRTREVGSDMWLWLTNHIHQNCKLHQSHQINLNNLN